MKFVLPILSSFGCLMFIRLFLTFYLFIILPNKSNKLMREVFMKIGVGLYAHTKFPMLTFRDYVV